MKNLSCQNIMHCSNSECPALLVTEMECWEIVKELEDYRVEFNICSDCLVYVLKNGSLYLSEEENVEMAAHKMCVLHR